MEDPELIALNKLKDDLVAKAYSLIEKLKEQDSEEQVVTLKLPDIIVSTDNREEKLQEEYGIYSHNVCEFSRQVSGITFKNIDKKWLHDNIYKYATYLVTKTLNFYVELTVKLEGEKEFEICDITCHFINIDKCYMLEIEPWVQNMTKMKNFSFLTSAISQYNEQSILRNKILKKMVAENYVSCKECTDENGGILVHVHSTENKKRVYLIFQWSILFLERYWRIEHHFIINSGEIGVTFAEENQTLLLKFCEPNLTKENLIDLWNNLCLAIDIYEDRNHLGNN
ncbi:hypothetical protein K0M31_019666 [Melipona bicolor]|uniref:Uncharacterized protein n=1 Tax=Melipona bicolor TaxID=60889 RepID=A0AA40KRF1_9HYME|nr:hypothetical protein K0M31_019666 [Melipona bicolor]